MISIPLSGTLSRVLSTRWMFSISAGGFTLGLARRVAGIGRACFVQDYDIVVARCVGPVNSAGRALPVHAALSLIGLAFRGLVLFAVSRSDGNPCHRCIP